MEHGVAPVPIHVAMGAAVGGPQLGYQASQAADGMCEVRDGAARSNHDFVWRAIRRDRPKVHVRMRYCVRSPHGVSLSDL
jgi:hypothetical protein